MQNVENSDCQAPPSTAPADVSSDGGLIVAGAALLAVLLGGILFGGDGDASIGDLERDGPKTPRRELLGRYAVEGLVYPGWPLVIEVAAADDATTFVQIATSRGEDGSIPPMVLSDKGGLPWNEHQVLRPLEIERTERGFLAKFVLPEALDGRERNGFRSARLTVSSGQLRGDEFVYSPLEVLAIGAGPSAVGSAAVEVSRFEPAPQGRRASYVVTFNAPRTFTSLRAELIKRERSGNAMKRSKVSSQELCRSAAALDVCQGVPPRVPFPIGGSWPTKTSDQLGTGTTYHMQLRAFSTPITNAGGWIVGQAPRVVTWR